ncbi:MULTISPECIES: hypothetical protein [unclassified Streptomyces]|uniref:hypothetical protein n=1 Tax=unclassified Streptomyces TaxID=2593676 RepID=UPI002E2816BA|nr:hypothetical protein [Streptomyces sp. NBC_00273]
MTDRTAAADHLAGYADIVAAACVTGRRLSRDERESCRTEGERAAEAGLPLRGLIRDHLAAAQTVRLAAPSGRVVPSAYFADNQLDGGSHRREIVGQFTHSRLSATTDDVQRRADRLVSIDRRDEAPGLVAGDRCLDAFAGMELAEWPFEFIGHGGVPFHWWHHFV